MSGGMECRIFGCIDNTTLTPTDYERTVEEFCRRTAEMRLGDGTRVAAVCVYPRFVITARRALQGSGIKVAAVAGAFPHGQLPVELKVEEVRRVVGDGADEVDVVINRGLLLAGFEDEVRDEVAAMKEACQKRALKVIIECCDLPTPTLLHKASMLAIEGGADFIKTSTGKGKGGATMEAARVMLEEIAAYRERTGHCVGFKAAGSIRTTGEALGYAELAQGIMGEGYIASETFRIGASSLTEGLYKQIDIQPTARV